MMLAIICPLFFEVITFKVFDILGTKNKARSLHDGPKRWLFSLSWFNIYALQVNFVIFP